MTLLSMTAYADTHGVKKQSAAEWKARGYLVMDGNMVDAEASDANMEGMAKGRFRVTAHGGRREAGVSGKQDRPGLDDPATPAPANDPWSAWRRLDSAAPLSTSVRDLFFADDEASHTEAIDLIDYRDWEDGCERVGWDRWSTSVSDALAADLGIPTDAALVRDVLQRHVRERLAQLGWTIDDLADPRLKPR